jgi:hypothetical protein
MSQTIVPAAPAGGPSTAPPDGTAGETPATLQGRVSDALAALRHGLSGTPGQLRLVSAVAVLAAVLVAIGGGAALNERSSALGEAKSSAAHLILVQGVQIRLAQANADATNSFLGFGRLEPLAQRLDYIAAIAAASRDLAVAANASPEDAKTLGEANAELTRYTGYVSSARANNRLSVQVGADYLSTASDLLKSEINPKLVARANADQKKIDAAYSRSTHAAWWLALVAIVGLGILVWAQFYLARHSRRILNVPLAAATVGLVIALIVALGAMALAQSRARDVRDGALSQATRLSLSRVAAFTAKSDESLTLIARGSATADDTDWTKSINTAKSFLPGGNPAASQALDAYAAEHKKINDLDVGNNWREAVNRAIGSDKTSANALFEIYASQTEGALTTKATATASGLGKAGNALLPAGILVILVGLLAAVGAWWGVTLRLDEYR